MSPQNLENPDSRLTAPWKRRHASAIPEQGWDAYRERGDMPEPTICPECHAVFDKGRWTWASPPAKAHEELCPACRRTRDQYPAGFLTIKKGDFFAAHHTEIMNLVKNEASAEQAEHPLHRLMTTTESGDGLLVTTTDIHLPRRIGEALHHAYHGEFTFQYTEDDSIIRAAWSR